MTGVAAVAGLPRLAVLAFLNTTNPTTAVYFLVNPVVIQRSASWHPWQSTGDSLRIVPGESAAMTAVTARPSVPTVPSLAGVAPLVRTPYSGRSG